MPQLRGHVDCVARPGGAFVGDLARIYSMGTTSHPSTSAAMRWLPAILYCLNFCLCVRAETALTQEPVADGTYDGRPVSDYISELADKDLNVRRRAAYILGQMGSPAKAAIPELVKLLEDRQSEPRWYAIDALGYFGPDAAEAVPAIIKSLNSKVNDAIVRRRGARSLGRIGPAAKEAIPTLEAAITSDDNIYRVAAAQALWQIAQHELAAETLIDVLKHGEPEAAMEAALALGENQISNKETWAALSDALGHADADVRQAAIDANVRMGPVVMIPLAGGLASPAPRHARESLVVLGMILDDLRRTSFDNDAVNQREFAAAAAPVVRSVLPQLAKMLAADDEEVRDAAGLAMAKAGSIALRELLTSLASDNPSVRTAAIAALVRLEAYLPRQRPLPPNAALVQNRAIEPLITALKSDDSDPQRAALRLFVALDPGAAATAAEPLLTEALQSDDLATRRYADKALAQLRAVEPKSENEAADEGS